MRSKTIKIAESYFTCYFGLHSSITRGPQKNGRNNCYKFYILWKIIFFSFFSILLLFWITIYKTIDWDWSRIWYGYSIKTTLMGSFHKIDCCCNLVELESNVFFSRSGHHDFIWVLCIGLKSFFKMVSSLLVKLKTVIMI